MQQCTRCVNDTSVRGITFDKDGVCNFCAEYDKVRDTISDYDTLQALFQARVDAVRGKYDYDAVVGISGGKDSVFVLYELIHKYNLKVKAFTMNNGFLSDEARKNVDRVVKEFGVEHEYLEFDHALLQRFYQGTMKKWLVPCIACSYIGYACMIGYASKMNAGMCIHGRSPEQMLRLYNRDVFSALVEAGLTPAEQLDINALYSGLLSSIHDKLDKNLMTEVEGVLLADVKDGDFREFVSYFLYHPYNEKEIVHFLSENTGWKIDLENYNHYDCNVHHAAKYIYQCLEGRAHAMPEISVLVRSGEMTREDALAMLETLKIKQVPKKELSLLFDFAGISKTFTLLKAKLFHTFFTR